MATDDKSITARELFENAISNRGGPVIQLNTDQALERRKFIKRFGVTIGAIPLGAGALTGVASANESTDNDTEVSTRNLTGREWGCLVSEARRSDELSTAAGVIGAVPSVETAIEYEIVGPDINTSGYSVIFGNPESSDPTIKYYRTGSEVKVLGNRQTDDGMRGVDGTEGITMDIGTETARTLATEHLGDELQGLPIEEAVEPTYEDAILYTAQDYAGKYLRVPVDRVGEIVDVIEISIPDNGATETVEIALASRRVGIHEHEICDPTGNICHDYCDSLCTALSGLSGVACFGACAGTIKGIPISPGCAAVCAGVVAGTCWPTCHEQTGH